MNQTTVLRASLHPGLGSVRNPIGGFSAAVLALGMALLPAAAQNPPTTTTLSAISITATAATLRESINPNGRITYGWFEWGTTGDYGNITPRSAFGSGTSPVTITRALTGLMPGTPYHFRAVGSNVLGVTYGLDRTFTTVAVPPPIVTTLAATDISPTAATLNESINPNGQTTHGWFQWGTTTNYGNSTLPAAFGSGNTPATVGRELGGLTSETTYHFRAVGSNWLGLVYGEDLTFETPAIPPRLVTTLADTGPGSLRQTIAEAIPGDRILIVTNGTITNFSGTLTLIKNLTIIGNGPTNTAISGNRANRVFSITAGATVSLADMTIREGKTSDGTPGPNPQTAGSDGAPGGGVLNAGTLVLSNCVMTLCATGRGGAGYKSSTNNPNLGLPGGNGGNGGDGAGICNTGNLTLRSCCLSGNTNGIGGAGGGGSPETTNSPAASGGNGGRGGDGGGVFNAGSLALVHCTFERNSAGVGGWGGQGGYSRINPQSVGATSGHGGDGGNGGGVASHTALDATNCLFTRNYGGRGGYGYLGGHGGFGPDLGSGGNGGNGGSGGKGGGIFGGGDVFLQGCTLYFNSAGKGGSGGDGGWAILGYPNQPVMLMMDYYPGDGGHGGLGGTGGNGGGAFCTAVLSLISCTVNSNNAGAGGYGGIGGEGGNHNQPPHVNMVWAGGDGGNGGVGGPGGKGGGIFADNGLHIVSCTVGTNVAGWGGKGGAGGYGGQSDKGNGGNGGHGGAGGPGGTSGGIIAAGASGVADLRNTLAAANNAGIGGVGGSAGRVFPYSPFPPYSPGTDGSPGSSGTGGSSPDLMGDFNSQGHNLIGLATGSTGFANGVNGDLVGTTTPLDPRLGPCQDNGGDTPTCALRPGSPAINAGDDSILDPPDGLATDQRGKPRQSGGHVDIGAYELQVAAGDIQVTGFGRSSSSSTQVRFAGESGVSYTVLMTTNCGLPMSNWSAVGSPTETAPGQFDFTDTTATNKTHRFYRVRSP